MLMKTAHQVARYVACKKSPPYPMTTSLFLVAEENSFME